jgi:hypothetical protein
MDKALEVLEQAMKQIQDIKNDIREAIARSNDTPEDADSEELNECINDLNSMLHEILLKI